MKRVIFAILILCSWQATAGAWGLDVHRMLTSRAIDGLPSDLRGLFERRRAFVVERSIDPDLWRVMDLRGEHGAEGPNHFLDIDWLDEPAPFTNVPRDRAAFVARYGQTRADAVGRVPWRAAEIYTRLVQAFRDAAARPAGPGLDNAVHYAAVLAHYIQDAHVPFHAVQNYDGQLTGQRGIHSRYESELVERYRGRLTLGPVVIRPIPDMTSYVFDTLVESASHVDAILAADTAAIGNGEWYDSMYFDEFFTRTQPTLEARLTLAASGVASAITSAWIEAGKPAVAVERAREPQRRSR